MFRSLKLLMVLLQSVFLLACASRSVLIPYPQLADGYRAALLQNYPLPPQTQNCLENGVLDCVERARVQHLQGDVDASIESLAQALKFFDGQALEAVVQVSDLFQSSAALVVNDNVREYEGAAYEKVYAHFEQAMNYWQRGQLESAGVEFRKAGLLQSQLADRYAYELAETLQEAEQELPEADWTEQVAYLDQLAGELKSSFLNPYVFYVSAIFWEATGELNAALVDYKKTIELSPELVSLEQDIARVEHKLGASTGYSKSPGSGLVWLLFEEGLAPPMYEERLSIFTGSSGYVSIAVPSYRDHAELNVSSAPRRVFWNNWSFDMLPMLDVLSLSSWHLQEQFPSIMLRQLLRAVSKARLQDLSHEKGGAGLAILASLYSIVSERADLRSWLTLPRRSSALRLELPSGKQILTIGEGADKRELEVEVLANSTQVFRLTQIGQQWYQHNYFLPN